MVDIEASSMNVSHVELASIFLRVGITVEKVDPAIGRLLVFVFYDRFDFPGERRIRSPLTMVIAGFDQMP